MDNVVDVKLVQERIPILIAAVRRHFESKT